MKKDNIQNIKNYLIRDYKRENPNIVIDEEKLEKEAQKLYRHKENDFRFVGAETQNHKLRNSETPFI